MFYYIHIVEKKTTQKGEHSWKCTELSRTRIIKDSQCCSYNCNYCLCRIAGKRMHSKFYIPDTFVWNVYEFAWNISDKALAGLNENDVHPSLYYFPALTPTFNILYPIKQHMKGWILLTPHERANIRILH